tara:strand:- start:4041 stop:4700 length:660 start_codon:yes stop_codon:yes gene_type:complete
VRKHLLDYFFYLFLPSIAWLHILMAAAAPVFAETFRILALGDSLTAGYGLSKDDAFTMQLERALKAGKLNVKVINGGVSGDTSAGGLARLGWALTDEPQLILIELGANDGLRGLDPRETERNLDSIISQSKKAGLTVVLSGMRAPPNLGREYVSEFNTIFTRLASKHDITLDPFFLSGVVAIPELNQDDAIHPNAKGVAIIVKRLAPLLKGLIEPKLVN